MQSLGALEKCLIARQNFGLLIALLFLSRLIIYNIRYTKNDNISVVEITYLPLRAVAVMKE